MSKNSRKYDPDSRRAATGKFSKQNRGARKKPCGVWGVEDTNEVASSRLLVGHDTIVDKTNVSKPKSGETENDRNALDYVFISAPDSAEVVVIHAHGTRRARKEADEEKSIKVLNDHRCSRRVNSRLLHVNVQMSHKVNARSHKNLAIKKHRKYHAHKQKKKTPLSSRVAYLCAPGMNTDPATTFSEEVEMLWLHYVPGCPTRCTRCEYRPGDDFLRGESNYVRFFVHPGGLLGMKTDPATTFSRKFRCYHYIIPRVTCTIPQVRIPTCHGIRGPFAELAFLRRRARVTSSRRYTIQADEYNQYPQDQEKLGRRSTHQVSVERETEKVEVGDTVAATGRVTVSRAVCRIGTFCLRRRARVTSSRSFERTVG
ncbi:unnamed protein product [Trichogramma brassicae]|uniref:Uncharacterized protein n=1 Tax=Trichogramma brassicae TaxID=86971 RepID=A0A6H5J2L9_9HYME|nr:unnamed protein product [Trichogramma brassicae]